MAEPTGGLPRVEVGPRPAAHLQTVVRAAAATTTPGWSPARLYAGALVVLVGVGTLLLSSPLANARGEWTPWLIALFTATSAACVSGPVVVDTGTYWSGFGQVVLLLLMEIGGLGFVTSATLLLTFVQHRATVRERLLVRDELGGCTVGDALALLRRVAAFTLIVEGVGALLLAARFAAERPLPTALWWGVFHAVSAFNNVGFDITGDPRGMVAYQHDAYVLLTLAAIFILGGLSYSTVADVVSRRRFSRLTLDSRLVLTGTAVLLVAGTALLLLAERNNAATLADLPPPQRLLNAFFQAASPRTAGFNSVDVVALSPAGLLVTIALMFVGGAAGSTAGGIKVQTVAILTCAVGAAVRGRTDVEAFGRRLPPADVLRALAIAVLGLLSAQVLVFALAVVSNIPFAFNVFEVVSAFAGVGMATGYTSEVGDAGLGVLIVAMFAGRLGPLTVALALAARERPATYRRPEESVRLG